MPDTSIVDLQLFLKEDGGLAPAPIRAMNVALHSGSIAAWVTREENPGQNERTNVPCRRSPGRRRCPGEIRAGFGEFPGEILWSCPVCGDNGIVERWQGTRWDRSPASDEPDHESAAPHPEAGCWPLRLCRGEAKPPAESLADENANLLDEFRRKLVSSGLSPKTVGKHVGNAEFYVTVFLQREGPTHAVEGVTRVGEFLGDWFIRKAGWASSASLRGNAASLKKFYAHLQETGRISRAELEELSRRIKTDMDLWIGRVREFHGEGDEVPWDF